MISCTITTSFALINIIKTFIYKRSYVQHSTCIDVDNSLKTNKQHNSMLCNSDDYTTLDSTIQCKLEQFGQFIKITNRHMNFVYVRLFYCKCKCRCNVNEHIWQ